MTQPSFLLALKCGCGTPASDLVVPVGRPVRALLRPVPVDPDRVREDDVALLTAWRNATVGAYLTEFVATPARTRAWLTGPCRTDDTRILFMLETPDREPFGYMGLAAIDWHSGACEADAIVRGRDGAPGLMSEALLGLIGFARERLGLRDIGLRVRSDNEHALRFYRRLGFVETHRVPLADEVPPPGERRRLVEAPGLSGADLHLVHHRFDPAARVPA